MNDLPELKKARDHALSDFHDWIDTPMMILGFIWLALITADLVVGLSGPLIILSGVIWIIFILEFIAEFILASDKVTYLKQNWLAAISLFLPGMRIFRILRYVRFIRFASATQGLRFLTIITSVNRGMKDLRGALGRRGLGYVVSLTLLVMFIGAAGMYAFENGLSQAFKNYWSSVWWTAMVMTTMGSRDWPQTPAGQILCLFLAMYAFAVFGYVTGSIASLFIGKSAENPETETSNAGPIDELRVEIEALREEIAELRRRYDQHP